MMSPIPGGSTLDDWKKRSAFERVLEWVGWIVERQQ